MVIKCPVVGCDGKGNALNAIKGTKHKTHQKEENCPNRQSDRSPLQFKLLNPDLSPLQFKLLNPDLSPLQFKLLNQHVLLTPILTKHFIGLFHFLKKLIAFNNIG